MGRIGKFLQLPEGETEASLFDYLSSFSLSDLDGRAKNEFIAYLKSDFRRFLYTLNLVPTGAGKLLEIGAHPFFTTLLLRRFRSYELTLTNGTGEALLDNVSTLQKGDGTEIKLKHAKFNLEQDELPFDKETFDVTLCCEIIEHMTNDPYRGLQNLNWSLKTGGTLILTTPNAARYENVLKGIVGYNSHSPYSAYGPYGRHNREYTPAEMHNLIERAGFRINIFFTADMPLTTPRPLIRFLAHLSIPPLVKIFRSFLSIVKLITEKPSGLGTYQFFQATKVGEPTPMKPAWLYTSYKSTEAGDN